MSQILNKIPIPLGDKELDKPIGQRVIIKAFGNLKMVRVVELMGNLSLYHALRNFQTLFFPLSIILEFGQRDTLYPFIKQQTQLILIIIEALQSQAVFVNFSTAYSKVD